MHAVFFFVLVGLHAVLARELYLNTAFTFIENNQLKRILILENTSLSCARYTQPQSLLTDTQLDKVIFQTNVFDAETGKYSTISKTEDAVNPIHFGAINQGNSVINCATGAVGIAFFNYMMQDRSNSTFIATSTDFNCIDIIVAGQPFLISTMCGPMATTEQLTNFGSQWNATGPFGGGYMLLFTEKNITKYISIGFTCSNGGDEWSSMYTNGQFQISFYLWQVPNSNANNCLNFISGGTMNNPTGSDLVNCNDRSFNMGLFSTSDCSGSPNVTYSGTGCSQGSYFDFLGVDMTSYTSAGCLIQSNPSSLSTTSTPSPPSSTLPPSASTTLPLWAVVTISLSGTVTLVAMSCLLRLFCLNRRRG